MSETGKDERFAEFLKRLALAPAAATASAAISLLGDTLNQVEDEMTMIPFSPENWQTDGRMYPPQLDSGREVPMRNDLIRYRSRAHNTFIRNNGAIEIQDIHGRVLFSKAGADGKEVELQFHR